MDPILQQLIDISIALMTPLIAVITVIIAWRQHKNDSVRLKYELYERRLAVYKGLKEYIYKVMQNGINTEIVEFAKFREESYIAGFLFDKRVRAYLEEIKDKSVEMWKLSKGLYPEEGAKPMPVGEERRVAAQKAHGILNWLIEQNEKCVEVFREYFEIP